jgi:hypothetical protein
MGDIERNFLVGRNTIRIKKNFGLKLCRIIKSFLDRILRLKLRVYSHKKIDQLQLGKKNIVGKKESALEI